MRTLKNDNIKFYLNFDEILNVKIVDVLNEMYNIPVKRRGNRYIAAIRDERTPSCYIYPSNTFCDFGDTNQGGSVIHLVMKLDECDYYTAALKISNHFNVGKVDNNQNFELSNSQWAKIGVQGDMATKNFDDIEETRQKLGDENAIKYLEKYRIPMNDLKNIDEKRYYTILRNRSYRFISEERDNYYNNLFYTAQLYKELGVSLFENEKWQEEYIDNAKELTKMEKIFMRALEKPEYFPSFKPRQYEVKQDMYDMLHGKIEWQCGITPYQDLKDRATKNKEKLMYFRVTRSEYHNKEELLSAIPYAAYCKADSVNLCYLPQDNDKIHKLFDKSKNINLDKNNSQNLLKKQSEIQI